MDIDDEILDLSKEDDDFMQISSTNNTILPDPNPQPHPSNPPARIRVVVRKRPIFRREAERGEHDIADVDMNTATCVIHEPKHKVDLTKYTQEHHFNFDECLDQNVDNEQIYIITVKPLVETLFNQGKATVFAYGQTGSGKTYTMMPLPVRAAQDILRVLESQKTNIVLAISCFEIYGSKLFDLLNRRRELKMLEDGKGRVNVKGLKEMVITGIETLQDALAQSQSVRSTGSTGANADSSRSHSIMQFSLREILVDGNKTRQLGKLSFIDLAGSERGADTFNNDQQTRMEGAEINKSLLALKECIRGLDSGQRHVPFRGSKLTQVLSDSFVGDNSRTVMIATISPNSKSCEHTLNTLRYADRVKELRNESGERGPTKVTPTKIVSQNKDAYGNIINKVSPSEKRGVSATVQESSLLEKRGINSGAQQATLQENQCQENCHNSHSVEQKTRLEEVSGPRTRAQSQQLQLQQQQQQQQQQHLSQGKQNVVPMAIDNVIEDGSNIAESNKLSSLDSLVMQHRQYVEGCMDIVRKELELITQIDKEDISSAEYVHELQKSLGFQQDMITEFGTHIQGFRSKMEKQIENQVNRKPGNMTGLRSGRRKK
eukprot:TRINITY_DN6150_c1_g1_i5.p1 TRINITY_DN6150_c1_g1~~TRINITY_DN6150_c1_g1_i5.p1  ORF type:complete len:603 (-),score=77.70 TRINITY_DN6150_c1_g1_i5:153-1961(-)